MGFRIVIPARYASTRLPGKPLREIAGKPMLQHVYERACESGADEVIIATDDTRIQQAAEAFAARVCMTATEHSSGTERIAEVLAKTGIADDEIIVNLQGDEPLMPAVCLGQVAASLQDHPQAQVATLCTPITRIDELFDPHIVKVISSADNYALYFSRAPIPWHRDSFVETPQQLPPEINLYFRHIGLYAYRAAYIKEYIRLPVCELEQTEALEQLRVLWHGGRIVVTEAQQVPGPGVDTEADLHYAETLLTTSS